MSLKYAIIGLLLEAPAHGYELKRRLSPALASKGLVNDGVLYPLLAKLEKDGWLKGRLEIGGEGAAAKRGRHVFFPTKKGERAFLAWLANDADEEDEVTYDFFLGHPFLAKCMFFERLDPATRAKKLEAQARSAQAKLEAFIRIKKGMKARAVDPWRIAILELGIAQQKQKLKWLEQRRKK
jgi:DNA-binding PadR family transcriptional regulator